MSRRAVIVAHVDSEGIAAAAGLVAGDRVLSVCGEEPADSLDFELLANEPVVDLVVRGKSGAVRALRLVRAWGESLGLAVTHRPRACRLACRFCFVDQQPRGMRGSLCLKDDDYALSFREGFFVTLSNLDDEDLERIITCRLSPLYVSVHATDPAVRAELLRPRGPAGRDVLPTLHLLAEHEITLHLQIVLAPGYNDGAALQRTLDDLLALGAALGSIAVVPVGLTRYQRDSSLRRFTPDEARTLLDTLQPIAERARATLGRPILMASDEWYLNAGREPPAAEEYAGFPQIENGVGLVRTFLDDLGRMSRKRRYRGALAGRRLTLVTGMLAAPLVAQAAAALSRTTGAHTDVLALPSYFWGPEVTIAGLLTGEDVARGLGPLAARPPKQRPTYVILPDVLLNEDGRFIDGRTLEDLKGETGLELRTSAPDPESLWACALNAER